VVEHAFSLPQESLLPLDRRRVFGKESMESLEQIARSTDRLAAGIPRE
jgi:hypothetical protein